MTRQIFLDTETTGLSAAAGDRIIEIGCVEMVNRRLSGRNLHFYLNPERSIHADAIKVHGLTEAFLSDKPLFAAVADELLAYVNGAEVLIHNAAFDVGFLNAELARLQRGPFNQHTNQITDTLLMARELYPGKANSLDALCKRLEVDNTQRELHGALLDSGLLAEVYLHMTRGQNSLEMAFADADESASAASSADRVHARDLSRFVLPLIKASEAENAAHASVLQEIDQASGGKTVWSAAPRV
jgi:DNA polymerase III subunit epsilon